MAGLDRTTPHPTEIKLHKKSRLLEMSFADGSNFKLPCEYLRVFSPSAEVRGHGPGQETLQTGKREVEITDLAAVGNYAIQPFFSDGHDTGIYSWDLLYSLGVNHDAFWAEYLARLETAGENRDVDSSKKPPKSGGGCGGGGGGSCGSH
jgi:DUF971 family protein